MFLSQVAAFLVKYGAPSGNFRDASLLGLYNRAFLHMFQRAVNKNAVAAGATAAGVLIREEAPEHVVLGLLFTDQIFVGEESERVRVMSDQIRKAVSFDMVKAIGKDSSDACAGYLKRFNFKRDPKGGVLSASRVNDKFLLLREKLKAPAVLKWGGSVAHGTAVTLSHDLDLVLEVPPTMPSFPKFIGPRRLWRVAHRRLREILLRNHVSSHPTLTLSTSGLSHFNLRKGLEYCSVNDMMFFPRRSSGIDDVPSTGHETTSRHGDQHQHHELMSNILEDYRASPPLLDLRGSFAEMPISETPPDWYVRTDDWAPGLEVSLRSTDEVLVFLLNMKLSPNVRFFIQLVKRWSKERFPLKGGNIEPLNGISITLFCLRFLWQLLGRHPGAEDEADEIGKLGAATALGLGGPRRHLILSPKRGTFSPEFVLELFFGFMRFLVGEAEEFFQCKRNERSENFSDSHDSPPKSCLARRWQLVPGTRWHAYRQGGGEKTNFTDVLPFHFINEGEREHTRVHERRNDYAEAFFVDLMPAQLTLAAGDRIRASLQNSDRNEEGVVEEVWMLNGRGGRIMSYDRSVARKPGGPVGLRRTFY